MRSGPRDQTQRKARPTSRPPPWFALAYTRCHQRRLRPDHRPRQGCRTDTVGAPWIGCPGGLLTSGFLSTTRFVNRLPLLRPRGLHGRTLADSTGGGSCGWGHHHRPVSPAHPLEWSAQWSARLSSTSWAGRRRHAGCGVMSMHRLWTTMWRTAFGGAARRPRARRVRCPRAGGPRPSTAATRNNPRLHNSRASCHHHPLNHQEPLDHQHTNRTRTRLEPPAAPVPDEPARQRRRPRAASTRAARSRRHNGVAGTALSSAQHHRLVGTAPPAGTAPPPVGSVAGPTQLTPTDAK